MLICLFLQYNKHRKQFMLWRNWGVSGLNLRNMLTEIQSTNGPDIEHKFLYKKQQRKKEYTRQLGKLRNHSVGGKKEAFPGSDSWVFVEE